MELLCRTSPSISDFEAMRYERIYIIVAAVLILTCYEACKEPYSPPEIEAPHNYLVIEGIINSGQDSTIITLSRTRNLSDTTSFIPEPSAIVAMEREGGGSYPLMEMGQGKYATAPLILLSSENYRLTVRTANGVRYASDFVPVKTTPAIDSLSWGRDQDVTIYLTTHDPANNTKYYRWEYVETWEYHSFFDSHLGYDYNTLQLFFLDSSQLLNKCWSSENSNSVLIGTSAKLSEDLIDRTPITVIPQGSTKMSVRYSILVRQYALTQEAFEYWQLLKKQSQQLGTLFDPQPSQLIGNIHCIDNPSEPVMGFVSISSVQQSRIFVKRTELPGWGDGNEKNSCVEKIVAPDSVTFYLSDTALAPAYYVTGGGVAVAKKPCVDCTRKGGTTQKPSYW